MSINIILGGGIAVLALVTIFQAGVLTGKFSALKETSEKDIGQNRSNIGELFKREREQDTQLASVEAGMEGLKTELRGLGTRIENDIQEIKQTINGMAKRST